MSTSTQTLDGGVSTTSGFGSKVGSFFHRIWQGMIESQERKAATMVRQHLAGLSDAQLAGLGYGPVAIKALRKHAGAPGVAWC